MLQFESVAMRHPDGTRALGGVSLEVPAGQFCVVLGASGAGKSTLLRTANGLVVPTQGTVRVEGCASRRARWRACVRASA